MKKKIWLALCGGLVGGLVMGVVLSERTSLNQGKAGSSDSVIKRF